MNFYVVHFPLILYGETEFIFSNIWLVKFYLRWEITNYQANLYLIWAFGGALLVHLEARRLWRSIMIHNFATRFARCSLVEDNGVDTLIDIFLVASLQYHLI